MQLPTSEIMNTTGDNMNITDEEGFNPFKEKDFERENNQTLTDVAPTIQITNFTKKE